MVSKFNFWKKILISIQFILDDPNPDIFLNEEAAKLYKENKEEYIKKCIKYIKKYTNYDIFKRIFITINNIFIFKWSFFS